MQRSRKIVIASIGILVALVVGVLFVGAFVLEIGDQQQTAPSTSFGSSGSGGTIGLSAGGAQDANDFRSNIENGYVPQPSSLSYEGLYHDYYFETGSGRQCEQRFCPSYSRAVTRDPLSGATERYVAVGLNSGIRKQHFQRPDLNLVVVVDTSGSMGSQFDEYHYDGGDGGQRETKMAAAKSALRTMTEHLRPGDRVGVVSFSDGATTVAPFRAVSEDGAPAVRSRIGSLQAGGSTNLAAGMDRARSMVARHADESHRETRIIYLTDAQPNTGSTGSFDLRNRLHRDAQDGIHTTFIGVGVDFNARLVESINTVDGANHYTVNTPRAFEERMNEGFAFMVSPIVTDLSLSVESGGYRVKHVYGVPSADDGEPATSDLIQVDTLFPSRKSGAETEGGVILVELEREDRTASEALRLTAAYETPQGERKRVTRDVRFGDQRPAYFESSGVRKAVVLTRYATLLRNWMAYERASTNRGAPPTGIERRPLGQWEQQSVDLAVSPPYDRRLKRFRAYFERQQRILGDADMDTDRRILGRLIDEAGRTRAVETQRQPRDQRSGSGNTAHPAGVTITHRGGDSLDVSNLAIRVARNSGPTGRYYGIGARNRTGITRPLWNLPGRQHSNRPLEVESGDSVRVRYYLQRGRSIAGQPTDSVIEGQSRCVVGHEGGRQISLAGGPAANDCSLRGQHRVDSRVGGALKSGDTVRVVWTATSGGKSQTLTTVRVPTT